MLYRPNFCCQCGEKIVRARWTPLTSRRFCDFCEVEQKQHDLLLKAIVVVAFLVGAAGLTAYLGGTNEALSSSGSRKAMARVDEIRAEVRDKPQAISSSNTTRIGASNATTANLPVPDANASTLNFKQREVPQNSSTEAVYYCGALTKKGTPCTRRVKTEGRCWQHAGQSAISKKRE